MRIKAALFLLLLCCTGCFSTTSTGGRSEFVSSTGARSAFVQPQNPKESSKQTTVIEREITPVGGAQGAAGHTILWTNLTVREQMLLAMLYGQRTEKTRETTTIEVGGSWWSESAANVKAYMKSMTWYPVVGIILLLFGGASMFWAPLRAIVNSTTYSLFICGAGALMIALPSLLSDPVIRRGTAVAVLGVAIYLYVHTKNAHKQGQLDALKRDL